jgi:hypothetical protein
MDVSMKQEIEAEIRRGASPLFLYGLVELASKSQADADFIMGLIDSVGTRLYLQDNEELCESLSL